jgi:cytochrome c-type biogenesis protein CcmH
MRRLALPVAVAALLALGGLVALEVLRPAVPATQAEEARRIAAELRCPDCQALSVAESQTASAAAIRREIVEQLAAGRTPDQVRAYFVARYGDWIQLAPSTPLVWWLPVLALLAGVGLLAWWLRRGRGQGESGPSVPALAREVRAQISEEVEQLDA